MFSKDISTPLLGRESNKVEESENEEKGSYVSP